MMIYFDNAATTRPEKEVLSSFIRANETYFANSESNHAVGLSSSRALEEARENILKLLKVEKTHSLIFTSGASESNNLALKGTSIHYQNRGKKIIASSVEHPSVNKPLEELEKEGAFKIVKLPVDRFGHIDTANLASSMDKETIIVSVMAVNNELGSSNDISGIAKIVHQYPKCFLHVDATQAIGKIDLPYKDIDLCSFSAHKFGGLKGNGGLIYKKTMSFFSVVAGGEQEHGFRAGTVDVAGAIAMNKALELALAKREMNYQNAQTIYEYLRAYFLSNPEQYSVHSSEISAKQTPFVLNVGFKKKKASVIVEALSNNDIYVSSVSACSSKEAHASSVLLSCGYSYEEASNSIRLSFGSENTLQEAKIFVETLERIMKEVIDR